MRYAVCCCWDADCGTRNAGFRFFTFHRDLRSAFLIPDCPRGNPYECFREKGDAAPCAANRKDGLQPTAYSLRYRDLRSAFRPLDCPRGNPYRWLERRRMLRLALQSKRMDSGLPHTAYRLHRRDPRSAFLSPDCPRGIPYECLEKRKDAAQGAAIQRNEMLHTACCLPPTSPRSAICVPQSHTKKAPQLRGFHII